MSGPCRKSRGVWLGRLRAAAVAAAVLLFAAVPLGAAPRADEEQQQQQQRPAPEAWAAVDCGATRGGQPLQYKNARFGFTMTYPPSFMLDPDSIPEGGDSARFWTADRRATAVVTGIRNGLGQSLTDLLDEASKDVTENSHGTITYTRARDNWFVISGFIGERIFYRRSFLSDRSRVIGSLWIEFPRTMRPCFEDAVSMMSLSFRPSPT